MTPLHPRLVAKLAGHTWQARRLAFCSLAIALRAVVARRGISVVSCCCCPVLSLFAFLAILLPLDVAVLSGATWCALGAALRVGGLPGLAVRAVGGLRDLAHLADGALGAGMQPRFVAKLTGQTRQAKRATYLRVTTSLWTRFARQSISTALAPLAALDAGQ